MELPVITYENNRVFNDICKWVVVIVNVYVNRVTLVICTVCYLCNCFRLICQLVALGVGVMFRYVFFCVSTVVK